MPKIIFETKTEDGTIFKRRQMDNGEFRDSITATDGCSYIKTSMPASAKGAWQNSHYHGGVLLNNPSMAPLENGVRETITVFKGWLGHVSLLPNGKYEAKIIRENEDVKTVPGIVHNFYMPPGAITHCVKYGDDVENPAKADKADWFDSPVDFDQWSKSLTEAELFQLADLSETEIAELKRITYQPVAA